jgi:hypothetical protein
VRPKFSCAHCAEGVVCAPLPPQVVEKGWAGTGLLAHLATSKYCDHLPLHRLEGIFARHGVEISRGTMCGWVDQIAYALRPIVAELATQIRASPVVQSDDTPIRVQDPAIKGKTKQGHLWVYRGGVGKGLVVFEYRESRSGEGPRAFLEGYSGYLQADAYSGYDRIFEDGRVLEVGCWAHARRKFFEALDPSPAEAAVALAAIRRLYELEEEWRSLDATRRKELRQERAAPIVKDFFAWLEKLADVVPQSALGLAVNYTRKLEVALSRFLEDGLLGLDNNAVERAIRPVAVGRKNWLFAGSDAGAERGAAIYSLVVSCKELGIDPFEYFRDVLDRVSTTPSSRIAELTPAGWLSASPAGAPRTTTPLGG